ncbi:MAG: aldo/keto reductase [Oscillospiraceae bacterium]|nr:aldo/keto reductase [Oscillospiraceae bacterium]
MRTVTLGSTGITSPQNAFGALPVQRADVQTAVKILRKAYDGGMTFFDTARAYSDSEMKLGIAFEGMRDRITIASKTMAATPEKFREDLETSLRELKTDYIDIHQFHMVRACYKLGDGTGLYECMLEAKKQGKIRHIGVTSHNIGVARECIASGLYETLQYPFSYLSSEAELELMRECVKAGMGFIGMKGLAGGLITETATAFAFVAEHENVLPIWGIQHEHELDGFLSYFSETPRMNAARREFIEREKHELAGDFCRGCGYCMPCPADIDIITCARLSLLIRRAPSARYLTPESRELMQKIENCVKCGQCTAKCPYSLKTAELLEKNYEDYKRILAGETEV